VAYPESEFVYPHDSAARRDMPRNIGAFGFASDANVAAKHEGDQPVSFPNPFRVSTQLAVPSIPDGIAQLTIINMTGALVERRAIMIQNHSATISRNTLGDGAYRYEIVTPHGSACGMFVIQ
jgi:hypothetical protein